VDEQKKDFSKKNAYTGVRLL